LKIIRLHREERGVAVVELAIALPVLLVVLLGIVEFGRALAYWNDTTQIASVGARWAVVNRWPGGETLQEAIQNEVPAQQGWQDLADRLQVCVDFVEANGNAASDEEIGDAVRVTVIFTFTWSFLPTWVDIADRDITSTATMRIENVPTYTEADNHPDCP
jgi:Flp pilus assembly protein TadG